MLRILDVIIAMLRLLRAYIEALARHDPDLARQLRRCGSSVALNASEGADARGRSKGARYQTALGSMRETKTCLDVAVAWGYVKEIDAELLALMNQVTGTLVRLVRR